jgi:UDP-glucose 4-epimerase
MVLINEAIRTNVSVFVFTSSIAVYGNVPPPMRETDQPMPDDPYGVSKYAVEMDLRTAASMFPPLKFVIFRPHNVYGPHQNVIDRYRNVLGIFISHIMRNLSLPIFGDGQQTRAFTYIDDVAPIIASSPYVPEAHNQVFNLGSDDPHNLHELATIISEEMNHPLNITYLPARHEVVHAHSDHSRVQCVFGLRNPMDLRTGIRKVIKWIRQRTESFVPVEFNEVEILRNMPPSWVTDKLVQNYHTRYEHNQHPSPSTHDKTIHGHHLHNDL